MIQTSMQVMNYMKFIKMVSNKRKVSSDAGASTATPAESNNAKRKRVADEMLAKHGEKDGKPPCYFYFRDGGTCFFSAAGCRKGHHGDDV